MFSGRTLGKVPELKDQEGQGRKKWVKTLAPESGRLQHMLHLLSEALGQFFFFFLNLSLLIHQMDTNMALDPEG